MDVLVCNSDRISLPIITLRSDMRSCFKTCNVKGFNVLNIVVRENTLIYDYVKATEGQINSLTNSFVTKNSKLSILLKVLERCFICTTDFFKNSELLVIYL